MVGSNVSDNEEGDSSEFRVMEDDFEATPEYTFIGIQVKRSTPDSIKKVVAKGALSNHVVRCGCHCGYNCNCSFKMPKSHYQDILENGLMLVHSMSGDDQSSSENIINSDEEMKFKCEHTCKEEILSGYFGHNVEGRIFEKLFVSKDGPAYVDSRFRPDVYLSGQVSKNIGIHLMLKKRSGFMEKLTAIHSTGLSVFKRADFLPEYVTEIASRIILNDQSVFKEVSPEAEFTYTELINSIIARSNDGSYPLASKVLRQIYGKDFQNIPEIDYTKLSYSTLQYFGRDPKEENKQKKKKMMNH